MKSRLTPLLCCVVLLGVLPHSVFSSEKTNFSTFAPDSLYPAPMGDPRYPGFSLAFPVILSQVIDA